MERVGVQMTLTIERGSDPIAGRILFTDGAELEFSGYMQLVSVLERVRAPQEPAASHRIAEQRPPRD